MLLTIDIINRKTIVANMKIYTRTGDEGLSSLWGGTRVSKASKRIEAYGEVDELNSGIGVLLAEKENALLPLLVPMLENIQAELMVVGSDLATPLGVPKKLKTVRLQEESVSRLEHEIDQLTENLDTLTTFILPSGSKLGSWLHFLRAVSRRAERAIVSLSSEEPVTAAALKYINRLSDWLFTAARGQNKYENKPEQPWHVT